LRGKVGNAMNHRKKVGKNSKGGGEVKEKKVTCTEWGDYSLSQNRGRTSKKKRKGGEKRREKKEVTGRTGKGTVHRKFRGRHPITQKLKTRCRGQGRAGGTSRETKGTDNATPGKKRAGGGAERKIKGKKKGFNGGLDASKKREKEEKEEPEGRGLENGAHGGGGKKKK